MLRLNSRKKNDGYKFLWRFTQETQFQTFFFVRPIEFLQGRFYPSLISLNNLPEIFSQIPVSQFVPLNEGLQ